MEKNNKPDNGQLALYNAISDHVAPQLLELSNVFSVGVGPKQPGTEGNNELCIVVLVDTSKASAKSTEHIPKAVDVQIEDLDRKAVAGLAKHSGSVRAEIRILEAAEPEISPLKVGWNAMCVGAGAPQTDVYYGMPLFNQSGDWIGTGGVILKDRNNRHVILSNRHLLTGNTDIFNYNGKLVARGIVESYKLDAAYAVLAGSISYSNYFQKMGKYVDHIEEGEGLGWHLQSFGSAMGYRDYHLDAWNCKYPGAIWSDPNYGRWRIFKDWTFGQTIPCTAGGESGTAIVGNSCGLNTLGASGSEDLGTHCQGTTQYRLRWGMPIQDVMNDLGLKVL